MQGDLEYGTYLDGAYVLRYYMLHESGEQIVTAKIGLYIGYLYALY